MIRSGLRRLFVIFAAIFALTGAVSVAIGALAHTNIARAVSVGFYAVGATVLVGSLVLGMRGPLRADWGDEQTGEMAARRAGLMARAIRRTTLAERVDARRTSLALFALGLALILIGAGFDPHRNAL